MKVKIYAIACIAALAAMLSGCGNSDNSAGEIKITSTSQTTAGTTFETIKSNIGTVWDRI